MAERIPRAPDAAFVPAMRPTPTACQPWCSDHANGTPADRAPELDDQLCRHAVTSPAFGEILVTTCASEGTVIHLHNTRDELAPAEAEAFAYTLLAQVAATRAVVAA